VRDSNPDFLGVNAAPTVTHGAGHCRTEHETDSRGCFRCWPVTGCCAESVSKPWREIIGGLWRRRESSRQRRHDAISIDRPFQINRHRNGVAAPRTRPVLLVLDGQLILLAESRESKQCAAVAVRNDPGSLKRVDGVATDVEITGSPRLLARGWARDPQATSDDPDSVVD
jgi:hypothetical protein